MITQQDSSYTTNNNSSDCHCIFRGKWLYRDSRARRDFLPLPPADAAVAGRLDPLRPMNTIITIRDERERG